MLSRLSAKQYALIGFVMIAITALVLLAMGRVPICTCGEVKLWTSDVNSSDNSQHISDWYTLSHIIHGMLFYALFWWMGLRFAGTCNWPIGFRAILSILVEAAWEILENSPIIIDRYREGTIAQGYVGDSVINSVFDIIWMLFGFWLAAKLPIRLTILLAVAAEVIAAIVIRDNLTLNVLMLLYPIDAVRDWQMQAY